MSYYYYYYNVTMATLLPAKNTLNLSFKRLYFKNETISNFDKQDKMQLLAKFKKILYMRFRATLNFRKFKVALNPMYRIFLNFAKSFVLTCLLNVDCQRASRAKTRGWRGGSIIGPCESFVLAVQISSDREKCCKVTFLL